MLQLTKPIYGLCNAAEYWHRTLAHYLPNDIRMHPTTGDLSFFYKKHLDCELVFLVRADVCDTINAGTVAFKAQARESKSKFKEKERS